VPERGKLRLSIDFGRRGKIVTGANFPGPICTRQNFPSAAIVAGQTGKYFQFEENCPQKFPAKARKNMLHRGTEIFGKDESNFRHSIRDRREIKGAQAKAEALTKNRGGACAPHACRRKPER
jgi:hypothetical protein